MIFEMRILFWNTYQNLKINIYVVNLIQEYHIDILIMAEYDADEGELIKLLEEYNENFIKCSTIGCNRIHIWSNYSDIKAGEQDTYYSIQIIKEQFILCCVHLMSDLYGDRSDERADKIQQMMHAINIYEDKIGSKQTMIIGDFNETPYGKGCLSANAFHGLPVLNVKDKATRLWEISPIRQVPII